MFDIGKTEKMAYLVHYPEGYKKDKKYPVVFLFHGSGSRGTNINTIKANSFFEKTKNTDYEFITVAPQCHENSWIDLWENVKAMVDEILLWDFCDTDRVYAIGPSMGGYAVWQIAMSKPEVFAAIVPICAGGMYWNAERLKNIPIWAFHGTKDEIIDCHDSQRMVTAVNDCGGNARLTLYPDAGHEIWKRVYEDKEVFDWLLSKRKGEQR